VRTTYSCTAAGLSQRVEVGQPALPTILARGALPRHHMSLVARHIRRERPPVARYTARRGPFRCPNMAIMAGLGADLLQVTRAARRAR
jgi:hypothetical protein